MRIVLDKGAYKPERAHNTDAGYDLRTPIRVVVRPHDSAVIDTGVHIEIPNGYVGMIKSKSGLNVNNGIVSEGVIDSAYTGSIVAKLYNHSGEMKIFEVGDKITQLVIIPYFAEELEIVDKLEETERGSNGFGSTGK